jgi:hypothetical protein
MKKVAVVGAKGNMGRRYVLILQQYCDCEVVEIEIDRYRDPSDCDGIIIATPTFAHYDLIKFYAKFGKPILCEKPICKSLDKLKELLALPGIDLSMVNQYAFARLDMFGFSETLAYKGKTSYNYYSTGKDGLFWDCINIIGLAEYDWEIRNDSPVWYCQINGWPINRTEIDISYVEMLKAWTNRNWFNTSYILPAHEKVWKAIDNASKG